MEYTIFTLQKEKLLICIHIIWLTGTYVVLSHYENAIRSLIISTYVMTSTWNSTDQCCGNKNESANL